MKFFFLIFFAFFINACGGPSQNDFDSINNINKALNEEIAILKNEQNILTTEISNLKKEIEELKFASNKLLSQGKLSFNEGKYELAKITFETLLAKHPDAIEAEDAKAYINKVDAELKKKLGIEEAKKEREEADNKKRIAAATKKMTKKFDEIEGITWYQESTIHPYNTSFHLYIGQNKDGNSWLRLKIRFYSDDWLFIKAYIIVADGQKFGKSNVKFERDNGAGSIWEWYDENVSDADIIMIKEIIKSKKTTLRFIGDKYHKDHTITDQEKKALQNVIDAFVALGGKIE